MVLNYLCPDVLSRLLEKPQPFPSHSQSQCRWPHVRHGHGITHTPPPSLGWSDGEKEEERGEGSREAREGERKGWLGQTSLNSMLPLRLWFLFDWQYSFSDLCFCLVQPKKKNTSAYQVFCKEYRVNINAEQPGLGGSYNDDFHTSIVVNQSNIMYCFIVCVHWYILDRFKELHYIHS